MKCKARVTTLAVILGVVTASGAIGAASPRDAMQAIPAGSGIGARLACSAATLQGAYGFTATGSLNGVGAVARVGRILFDGKGHASGTATTSGGGSVFASTYTVTYKVNPDCTGTTTEVDSMLGTVHDSIVIVDGGRAIQGIATDQGGTITAAWQRQLP